MLAQIWFLNQYAIESGVNGPKRKMHQAWAGLCNPKSLSQGDFENVHDLSLAWILTYTLIIHMMVRRVRTSQ